MELCFNMYMLYLKIRAKKSKKKTNGQTNAIFLVSMCGWDIINQNILLMPQQICYDPSLLRSIKRHLCKKKVCHFCAPLWRWCELRSLTWIWVNLLYILQSLPSFLCFSSFIPTSVYKCHRPRRYVAWTVVMVPGIPTRSGVSPLSRWHRDTKCAAGRFYYYTAAARGVAAPPETLTREEIAEWTQPAHQVQPERKASWEEVRNYRKRVFFRQILLH